MSNAVKWMGRCNFELEKVKNRRSAFSQWRYAKMTLAAKAQDQGSTTILSSFILRLRALCVNGISW